MRGFKVLILIFSMRSLLLTQSLIGQVLLEQTLIPSLQTGSIKQILQSVEEQTNITFIYDGGKIDMSQTVEVSIKEYTVQSLLDHLFPAEEFQFIIKGNGIILKRRNQDEKQENDKATIYGYITDKESGENLTGTSIVDKKSGLGAISNYYGYYSLTLPTGEVNLQVSFIGTKRQTVSFVLVNDVSLNVGMEPDDVALEEVVVTGNKLVPIQETTEMGTINLTRTQIQSRPAIGGEVDVIKALQLLPGVQSGIEGSSGLYVRGGGPDQNLILLDGVPVYNTSHLFGFSSVFNSDAINSVKLIKGAFPARYGGRLSSVVDMSMKEGNAVQMGGVANISFMASSIMLEGPIVKDKTSFMVAARRSFVDLLAGSFTDNEYYFYDLNLKVNHRFSDKDRVYFSSYLGRDSGQLNESQSWVEGVADEAIFSRTKTRSEVDWGSAISLVRWNHLITPKLFSNLSLSYSTYDFEAENNFFSESISKNDTLTEYQRFITSSDIVDQSIKLDFDYFPHPDHSVKFGIQAVRHQFKPNVVGLIASEQPDVKFNALNVITREQNFYLEDDFKVSRKIIANLGVHAARMQVSNASYTSIQPRASILYLINKNLSLKTSYSEMAQFQHLLTNPGLGLPTDLWVPVTEKVPPQESTQYSLGLAYSLPRSGLELTLEGYYKDMNNLIEYKDGANFLKLNEDWQDKINLGKGKSYGLELFVSRKWKKFEGWFGYTLAWSNRTFKEINFGNSFPYKYDRRHDVNVVLTHHIRKNVHLSANWVYGTGIAITLPSEKYLGPTGVIGEEYRADPTPLLNYESRNGFRQRASHRLDISASFVKKKKRGERTWIVTIYNVYNRRNPVFIETRPTQSFDGLDWNLRFKEYSFLSILPSITYRFSFKMPLSE